MRRASLLSNRAKLAIGGGLAATIIAVSLLVWSGFRPGADGATVALGRSLYAEHCASCHGSSLEGQPNWQTRLPNGRMPAPPHDASGHTWHHSDAQLFAIVKRGVSAIVPGYESDMPGFQAVLSDDEIGSVLAFIKSTWPDRERQYQTERSRADRQ